MAWVGGRCINRGFGRVTKSLGKYIQILGETSTLGGRASGSRGPDLQSYLVGVQRSSRYLLRLGGYRWKDGCPEERSESSQSTDSAAIVA